MYKALIFDFDSTLVDYHAGEGAAIDALLPRLPKQPERSRFVDISVEVLWDLYDGKRTLDGNLHRSRLRQTLELFDIPWDDQYLETWLSVYLKHVPVYDGVLELFQRLHGTIPLALLTNAIDSPEQRQRISASGLEPFFSVVGIAQEIGWFKPQPEAFYWVADRLGVKPHECVFIGDSEAHDIAGARAAGMYAIRKFKPKRGQTTAALASELARLRLIRQSGGQADGGPAFATEAHASFCEYAEFPELLQAVLP